MKSQKVIFCSDNENENSLNFIALESSNIVLKIKGIFEENPDIKYKINDQTTEHDYYFNNIISLNEGDVIRFYNLSNFLSNIDTYVYFSLSRTMEVSGNLSSMINLDSSDTFPAYCFRRLFENCSTILSFEKLIIPDKTSRGFCQVYLVDTRYWKHPLCYQQ